MQDDLDTIKTQILEATAAANSLESLERVRVEALGRKGRITALMKGLGAMDPETRKSAGAALNVLKDDVAAAIEARKEDLAGATLDARLMEEKVDVTLPVRAEGRGRVHPIT